MNIQEEMIAANVKNWLMDLATGVKARQKQMKFALANDDEAWRVTARCYDDMKQGIAVHKLKALAKAIDVTVKFGEFDPNDYLYGKYPGYWYFEMFGVTFYDFAFEGEELYERK